MPKVHPARLEGRLHRAHFRHLGAFFARVEDEVSRMSWRDGGQPFPLFRGSGDDWDLMPTLQRAFHDHRIARSRQKQVECDLFFEFEARASEQLPAPSSDWDTLFLMRHHGVPTRLLDWTESLLMAAYFALNSRGDRPRIWILNPFALNAHEQGWGHDDLVAPRFLGGLDRRGDFTYSRYLVSPAMRWPVATPIALYPLHTNPRLRAQRGYFTLHGEDCRPVNEQLPREVSFVELEEDLRDPLHYLLGHAGLTHFLMHQSLDGLARDLVENYFPAG